LEKKDNRAAWHWWLMPLILATWEADVRRIVIADQLRKIVHKTPSSK
jgi:hypothetical protein